MEPVEPYEFYREIFPKGSFERKGHFEDRKGNGIAVTVPKGEVDKATGIALQIEGDGKAKRCTITDELDELRELQDTDLNMALFTKFCRPAGEKIVIFSAEFAQ